MTKSAAALTFGRTKSRAGELAGELVLTPMIGRDVQAGLGAEGAGGFVNDGHSRCVGCCSRARWWNDIV